MDIVPVSLVKDERDAPITTKRREGGEGGCRVHSSGLNGGEN